MYLVFKIMYLVYDTRYYIKLDQEVGNFHVKD